jgi:hypothetical protein
VNGSFAVDASWAKSAGCTISGGNAVFTAAANNTGFTQGAASIPAATWYKVSFTVTAFTAGGIKLNIGSTLTSPLMTAVGPYSGYIYSGASAGDIELLANGATTASVTNFSAKPVLGNHVTQATGAARPEYDVITGISSDFFDGSDDAYASAAGVTLVNGMDCFIAVKRATCG